MVVIHLAHPFRNHLDLSIIMFDESNLVFIKLVFACGATYVRRSKFLCFKNILQTFSRILLSRGCFLVSFFQLTLADWNQWGSVTSAAFMAADRASIAVTKLNRRSAFL